MVKRDPKVSVVIVTKNRMADLSKCLRSLEKQTTVIDELVIIDNNSNDNTKKVIRDFSGKVEFPVRYILEKKVGYPVIYNRGLKEVKYQWTAFIDDDCVANEDWLENIKKAISKNPQMAAILGFSDTYYCHNPYSLATFVFNYQWKENGTLGQKIIDMEILDNRNIVYNKSFFKKHNIRFDEDRTNFFDGAGEDCDLGMQIQVKKGKAIYIKEIYVKHKDPVTFEKYFKKLVFSSKAYGSFGKKWQKYRDKVGLSKRPLRLRLRNLLPEFIKEYRLSWIMSLRLLMILTITILLKSIISLTDRD